MEEGALAAEMLLCHPLLLGCGKWCQGSPLPRRSGPACKESFMGRSMSTDIRGWAVEKRLLGQHCILLSARRQAWQCNWVLGCGQIRLALIDKMASVSIWCCERACCTRKSTSCCISKVFPFIARAGSRVPLWGHKGRKVSATGCLR